MAPRLVFALVSVLLCAAVALAEKPEEPATVKAAPEPVVVDRTQEVADMQNKLSALETSAKTCQEEMEKYQTHESANDQLIAELKDSASKLGEQVAALEKDVGDKAGKLSDAEAQVSKKGEEVEALKKEVGEITKALEAAKAGSQDASAALSDQSDPAVKVNALKKQIEEKTTEVESLANTKVAEINGLKEEITTLTAHLENAQSHAKDATEKATAEIENLKREILEKQDEIIAFTAKIQEAAQKDFKYAGEIEDLKQQIQGLNNDVAQGKLLLEESAGKTGAEMEALKEKSAGLAAELEASKAAVAEKEESCAAAAEALAAKASGLEANIAKAQGAERSCQDTSRKCTNELSDVKHQNEALRLIADSADTESAGKVTILEKKLANAAKDEEELKLYLGIAAGLFTVLFSYNIFSCLLGRFRSDPYEDEPVAPTENGKKNKKKNKSKR